MALEETVFRYCAYTRIRDREGRIGVLPADIAVAMFQHGTSRENDPLLHTYCVIFNVARTREDGKWRAMHQYPVYSWAKAVGAVYRNALAWNLRERLGVPMEQYGPNAGLTRIEGMPEDLQVFWSKRRKAIVAKAGELGIFSLGNASRTEIYSTRHNHRLEQAVKDMTAAMAADTGHELPEEAVREKVEALLKQGYPLSQEQLLAIRHATVKGDIDDT